MSIIIPGTASAGMASLGMTLPNRQNLALLVVPSLAYQSGGTVLNFAAPTVPLTIIGAPTFSATGMTVNAYGDGLLSSVLDPLGDLTAMLLVQDLDTDVGPANQPVFLTTFATDAGAALPGYKGFFVSTAPNKVSVGDVRNNPTGTVAVSSWSRTGSALTLTVATVPAGLVAGGPVYCHGFTGDLTLNGIFLVTSVTSTTIVCTSAGPAGSGAGGSGTAALAVYAKYNSNWADGLLAASPRVLLINISAAAGTTTITDLSTGAPAAQTFPTPGTRLSTAVAQPFVFGTGLGANAFGKHKLFAAAVHTGYNMPLAQAQQNAAVLVAKTGFGA